MDSIAHARSVCPELVIVKGEDLTPFRQASLEIFTLLNNLLNPAPIQRLGLDEFYADVTELAHKLCGLSLTAHDAIKPGNTPEFPTERFDPSVWHGHVVDQQWTPVAEAATAATSTARSRSASPQNSDASADESVSGKLDVSAAQTPKAGSEGEIVPGETLSEHDRQWPSPALLQAGTAIAAWLRATIFTQLNYTCRAGIAANKLLAKVVGDLHKPNDQTCILPSAHLRFLLSRDLRKVGCQDINFSLK